MTMKPSTSVRNQCAYCHQHFHTDHICGSSQHLPPTNDEEGTETTFILRAKRSIPNLRTEDTEPAEGVEDTRSKGSESLIKTSSSGSEYQPSKPRIDQLKTFSQLSADRGLQGSNQEYQYDLNSEIECYKVPSGQTQSLIKTFSDKEMQTTSSEANIQQELSVVKEVLAKQSGGEICSVKQTQTNIKTFYDPGIQTDTSNKHSQWIQNLRDLETLTHKQDIYDIATQTDVQEVSSNQLQTDKQKFYSPGVQTADHSIYEYKTQISTQKLFVRPTQRFLQQNSNKQIQTDSCNLHSQQAQTNIYNMSQIQTQTDMYDSYVIGTQTDDQEHCDQQIQTDSQNSCVYVTQKIIHKLPSFYMQSETLNLPIQETQGGSQKHSEFQPQTKEENLQIHEKQAETVIPSHHKSVKENWTDDKSLSAQQSQAEDFELHDRSTFSARESHSDQKFSKEVETGNSDQRHASDQLVYDEEIQSTDSQYNCVCETTTGTCDCADYIMQTDTVNSGIQETERCGQKCLGFKIQTNETQPETSKVSHHNLQQDNQLLDSKRTRSDDRSSSAQQAEDGKLRRNVTFSHPDQHFDTEQVEKDNWNRHIDQRHASDQSVYDEELRSTDSKNSYVCETESCNCADCQMQTGMSKSGTRETKKGSQESCGLKVRKGIVDLLTNETQPDPVKLSHHKQQRDNQLLYTKRTRSDDASPSVEWSQAADSKPHHQDRFSHPEENVHNMQVQTGNQSDQRHISDQSVYDDELQSTDSQNYFVFKSETNICKLPNFQMESKKSKFIMQETRGGSQKFSKFQKETKKENLQMYETQATNVKPSHHKLLKDDQQSYTKQTQKDDKRLSAQQSQAQDFKLHDRSTFSAKESHSDQKFSKQEETGNSDQRHASDQLVYDEEIQSTDSQYNCVCETTTGTCDCADYIMQTDTVNSGIQETERCGQKCPGFKIQTNMENLQTSETQPETSKLFQDKLLKDGQLLHTKRTQSNDRSPSVTQAEDFYLHGTESQTDRQSRTRQVEQDNRNRRNRQRHTSNQIVYSEESQSTYTKQPSTRETERDNVNRIDTENLINQIPQTDFKDLYNRKMETDTRNTQQPKHTDAEEVFDHQTQTAMHDAHVQRKQTDVQEHSDQKKQTGTRRPSMYETKISSFQMQTVQETKSDTSDQQKDTDIQNKETQPDIVERGPHILQKENPPVYTTTTQIILTKPTPVPSSRVRRKVTFSAIESKPHQESSNDQTEAGNSGKSEEQRHVSSQQPIVEPLPTNNDHYTKQTDKDVMKSNAQHNKSIQVESQDVTSMKPSIHEKSVQTQECLQKEVSCQTNDMQQAHKDYTSSKTYSNKGAQTATFSDTRPHLQKDVSCETNDMQQANKDYTSSKTHSNKGTQTPTFSDTRSCYPLCANVSEAVKEEMGIKSCEHIRSLLNQGFSLTGQSIPNIQKRWRCGVNGSGATNKETKRRMNSNLFKNGKPGSLNKGGSKATQNQAIGANNNQKRRKVTHHAHFSVTTDPLPETKAYGPWLCSSTGTATPTGDFQQCPQNVELTPIELLRKQVQKMIDSPVLRKYFRNDQNKDSKQMKTQTKP